MTARRRHDDPEARARRTLADAEERASADPANGALQLRVAECSLRLGDVLQQQELDPAARRCFDRARRIAETEARRQTTDAAHLAEARRLWADALLASGTNLQVVHEYPAAADAFRQCLELLGPLPKDDAVADRALAERVAQAHGNLAVSLDESDQSEDAFGHYRISLGIGEAIHSTYGDARSDHQLALAHNGIAHHYSETDRLVDAAFHHQQSLEINERLLRQEPSNDHLQYCLATDHENLFDLAWRRAERDKALTHARRALELRAALCDAHGAGAPAEWLQQLAESHRDLAELLQDFGRHDEAIRHHRAVMRLAQRLRATWPEEEDYLFRVADSLLTLGYALEEDGQLEPALASYRSAQDAHRELVDASPNDPRWHANAAQSELCLALVLLRLQRDEEAQRHIDSGLAMLDKQIAAAPPEHTTQLLLHDMSRFHSELAMAWLNRGIRQSAEHHLRASLRLDRKLLQQAPQDEHTIGHLAITYDNLAAIREEAGDFDGAAKFCILAVRAEESLVARDPESSEYQLRLAQALLNQASVFRSLEQPEASSATLRKAARVQLRLQRLLPDQVEVSALGGQIKRTQGILARDKGDIPTARRLLDQALAVFEELYGNRSNGGSPTNIENHLADSLEARLELTVDGSSAGSAPAAPPDPASAAEFDDVLRRAVALRRQLAEARGSDVLAWRDLARLFELGADGHEAFGRYEAALDFRRSADEIYMRFGRDS